MCNLILLIGLPRSGKSTYAKEWVSAQPKRVVVSGDDIRLSLGHRYNFDAEPIVKSTMLTMTKALLRNHDVLVDETNTSKKSRLDLFLIDPEAEWVYIDTSMEECVARAVSDGQPDLIEPIQRMKLQLDINMYSLNERIEQEKEEARIILQNYKRCV